MTKARFCEILEDIHMYNSDLLGTFKWAVASISWIGCVIAYQQYSSTGTDGDLKAVTLAFFLFWLSFLSEMGPKKDEKKFLLGRLVYALLIVLGVVCFMMSLVSLFSKLNLIKYILWISVGIEAFLLVDWLVQTVIKNEKKNINNTQVQDEVIEKMATNSRKGNLGDIEGDVR